MSEYWLADPIALAFHALALARIATSRSPPVGAVVRSAVFPGLEVGVASLFADPS